MTDNTLKFIDITDPDRTVFPEPYSVTAATIDNFYWVVAATEDGFVGLPHSFPNPEDFSMDLTVGVSWDPVMAITATEDSDQTVLEAVRQMSGR